MSAKKLSNGERKVVNAFNGSIKETAKKVGMSYGYVRNVVAKDYIIDAIQKREEKENAKGKNPLIADRQERQQFWSSIMRGDPQVEDLVEKKGEDGKVEKDKDGNPVMVEVKKVSGMVNRLKAAELLGKSNADFVEKRILSTDPDNPLEFKQKFDTIEEVEAEMVRRGLPMDKI